MLLAALALAISLASTYLLVRFSHLHFALTADSFDGPQKFHLHRVSRVGGLSVFAGFVGGLAIVAFAEPRLAPVQGTSLQQLATLLLCSLPAFGAGFIEDITKRVGVRTRLIATMLAAGVSYYVLGGVLNHVDVPGIDHVLAFNIAALAFTMVAVGGIANAINIVDGYNGLAGAISIFIFAALGYVAWEVGDMFIVQACLLMSGAIGGFLVWNFPAGKIFLGDGGAYFVGFMIGELSVILVGRHPEVSPWFPLMLVAYPVWETLFSIYRKKLVKGASPGDADGLHFHQLIYKRVMRWKVGSHDPTHRVERNSFTSPYLWLFALTTIVPAVLFWRSTLVLAYSAFAFAFVYVWLYRRIVNFRVPTWMIVRRPLQRPLESANRWTSPKSREGP